MTTTQQIKKQLKAQFPGIKFSCRTYSGDLHIMWTVDLGTLATPKRVEEFVSQLSTKYRVDDYSGSGDILEIGGKGMEIRPDYTEDYLEYVKDYAYQNWVKQKNIVNGQ